MTTPHDKALAAIQDISPDRINRLWWLLFIMSKSGGTTDANQSKWSWLNAFCDDFEKDTFNLAIDLKLIRCSHSSDDDTSTARITDGGKALVAYFSTPPVAPIEAGNRGDGWLPIETAPKTGESILADHAELGEPEIVAWDNAEKAWCTGSWCWKEAPTLWRPLPARRFSTSNGGEKP